MQQIIDMINDGTKMTESEHDALVYEVGLALAESYEIKYDPKTLIPADDDMAGRVLDAAIDLLEMAGVYSIEAKKNIFIPREKTLRSIQNSRSYLNIGEGRDKYLLNLNDAEHKMPLIMGGPNASPVTPDMYIPIHRSYAKYTDVNAIAPAFLDMPPVNSMKKGPSNLMHAREAVQYVKEACALEGRPDMCIVTPPHIEDPVAAVSVANPRFMGLGDMQEIIPRTDLKITYDELSRIYHYRMTGSNYMSSPMVLPSISTDSPEQFAIKIVAEDLKSQVIYGASVAFKYPAHINPEDYLKTLWASFIATAAVSTNEVCLQGAVVNNFAGPCTEMMMYETALQTVGYVACGCDILSGPVSNNGSVPNHSAGLDAHFMAEIARYATKLSKKDADDLCMELYNRYKDKLMSPDIGLKFSECYNTETIEPTEKFLELREKVISDIYKIRQKKQKMNRIR
ncbi:MAG: monomethylamine:corrinoid methyltransferase [Methanimicrococcus sp.]|nr:monomethylamine:corrinoid methyltransferase [Methanimicrococcus sp.]